VPHSTQLDNERTATSTPESEAGVRVVGRHHLLVRCSHWLNVPILLGLILSGMSIYWASPVYQHKPDPLTGNVDPLADVGIWICAHVPGLHQYSSPPDWIYNHVSLACIIHQHWKVSRTVVGIEGERQEVRQIGAGQGQREVASDPEGDFRQGSARNSQQGRVSSKRDDRLTSVGESGHGLKQRLEGPATGQVDAHAAGGLPNPSSDFEQLGTQGFDLDRT
jgi:hypothetical protein